MENLDFWTLEIKGGDFVKYYVKSHEWRLPVK